MAFRTTSSQNARPLKPVAQAFLLALLSTAGPQALSTSIALARRKKSLSQARADYDQILQEALSLNSFPNFCAVLVGGSTLLPKPLLQIISKLGILSRSLDPRKARILSRFLAALISSAVAFHLFNGKSRSTPSLSRTNSEDVSSPRLSSKERSKIPPNIPKLPLGIETSPLRISRAVPLAGRTLDLTIYAFIRAIDTSMQFLPSPTSPTLQTLASVSSPALFILSSAVIMHSYFYAPLALPRTYVHWITRLAAVDPRLVHALRQVRFGNFIYGKDTGIAPLLGSMARDLGLPEEYGDPAKSIPVPCELVHHGTGKSCEYHAAIRLTRTMKVAMGVYAPLQAFILLRRLTANNAPRDAKGRLKLTGNAALDTLRSASFLASFVSLFYYGVCLARTRVGPKAFPTITPQMWDGGLCVLSGCMACGWSVLIERPRRQTELMLFVVPRAAGVFVPRRYPATELWKEHVVFSISAAVLLTAIQTRPEKVRGFLGGLLAKVMGL